VSDTRHTAACGPQADRNLTPIATLIEDPARSAMLAALAGGRAPPGNWRGEPACSRALLRCICAA
jgi:hypothetical protein